VLQPVSLKIAEFLPAKASTPTKTPKTPKNLGVEALAGALAGDFKDRGVFTG